MDDKEIIIDGVNVSGCKHFDCGCKECKAEYYVRYGYEIVEYDSCRDNPNCHFKQLKRAEQKLQAKEKEYEELQKRFNDYQVRKIEENAILREFLNQYQEEAEALKSYETYKIWLNNKCRKESEKYKQALDEIEEFCTVYSADHDEYEMVYKDILAFIDKAKKE